MRFQDVLFIQRCRICPIRAFVTRDTGKDLLINFDDFSLIALFGEFRAILTMPSAGTEDSVAFVLGSLGGPLNFFLAIVV